MTSTPEPSASQTPAPPTYSGAEQHHGHRLSAGVVALMVTVIVVIAAVVTALVVFTHKPNPPAPPQPSPGGGLVQPAAGPAPNSGKHTPSESIGAPEETATPQESFGSGTSISFTNGVSLTPASGWSVASSSDSVAALNRDDGTASLLVVVGPVKSSDVEEVLNGDIAQAVQKMGMDNVKVSQTQTGQVQSPNFQQVAKRGFQADLSTQQGTQSVVGMFLEFLNTSNHNAAFVLFMAKDDKSFDASVDDVNGMIKSLLAASGQ